MINEFSELTGISVDAILGRSRKKNIALHRAVYWRLLHDVGYSYSEIGRLNDRTHAAVMSAVKMVNDALSVGIVEIKEIVNKTKYLKNKYMLTVRMSIDLEAPDKPVSVTQEDQIQSHTLSAMKCACCNGAGWFYQGGYMKKFKQDLNAPNWTKCRVCKGTGKVKAVVSVNWLPDGDVIVKDED